MALALGRQPTIALDIGGSSIVAVQLAADGSDVRLKACYEWPIPEGLVVDGEIVEPDLLARELKRFVGESGMRGKAVQLGVSNQKVIVRNIEMPDMTEQELRGAIEFQAQDYIPIPVEEVILDFQVIARHIDAEGTARQEVLLVAAQRAMVENFMETARQAGLKVSGIDVSALALIRSLIPPTGFLGQGRAGECLGVADVGSSVSTLVVCVDRVPKFTRIINFSSEKFAHALMEKRGILYEDAEALVQRVGLPGPMPADEESYAANIVQEVRVQLQEVTRELVEELRRSFDYYRGQEYASPVESLVLSGRGAMLRNLDAHLAESLQIPVRLGNPVARVTENATGLSDEVLQVLAPRLAVAVGLALEEPE